MLNYFGYFFVEKCIKLDEVFGMIECVVEVCLDFGYIVDSFGWVFYCLGCFEEVVDFMECVVVLMFVDFIVNDYFGDVYWKVGCKIEVCF